MVFWQDTWRTCGGRTNGNIIPRMPVPYIGAEITVIFQLN
jgi:hypothetical protein